MVNIRKVAIALNQEFQNIEDQTGLYMQRINVGSEPGDYTGDLIDDALVKVVENVGAFADWVITNTKDKQTQDEYDGYPH
jgi:hypothetical protein